jgi:hypothetical protein
MIKRRKINHQNISNSFPQLSLHLSVAKLIAEKEGTLWQEVDFRIYFTALSHSTLSVNTKDPRYESRLRRESTHFRSTFSHQTVNLKEN